MACGDRYAGLIVTTSGLNLENPWDDYPTFDDFEEWRELARRLMVQAQTHKDVLGELESSPFTQWNAVVELYNEGFEKLDALPSFFTMDPKESIADAQVVCQIATCVLERADDAIAALGGTAPEIELPHVPKRENPDKTAGIGNAIVTGVLVIGGIIVAVKVLRR